jgi:hypothetical protein
MLFRCLFRGRCLETGLYARCILSVLGIERRLHGGAVRSFVTILTELFLKGERCEYEVLTG